MLKACLFAFSFLKISHLPCSKGALRFVRLFFLQQFILQMPIKYNLTLVIYYFLALKSFSWTTRPNYVFKDTIILLALTQPLWI